MENEIMNYEVMDDLAVQGTEQRSLSTGGAIAIGAIGTIATIAVGKFVKKLLRNRKAKKEAEQAELEAGVTDADFVK